MRKRWGRLKSRMVKRSRKSKVEEGTEKDGAENGERGRDGGGQE